MVNRAQRRKMRSMNRRGKGPQVQVREDGEVQLGVSVREGAVVMTLAAPDGQTMVLGVPPDSARQFAVALDDAADAVESGATKAARKEHVPGCFQSCPRQSGGRSSRRAPVPLGWR